LRYTLAQKRAFKNQLDQAQERYEVGVDAITSVYNARASYDLTVAQEIADRNSVENNLEKLRELTGVYYEKLSTLKENFPFLPPNPINVERWVAATNAQNLNLKAALFKVDAAREFIKQAFAGHFPVLNGFGSYDRIKPSNTGFGAPNDQYSSIAGVELKLPIYQGGLITSQTQQARDNYLKSIADMESTERQTDASMRQTYNNILALISKIDADRESIISNESSVESTEAALTVGTRTMVDLLNAQEKLYNAEQMLAEDQYNYITQTLTLKELAGTLGVKDLAAINTWLTPAVQNKEYTDILVKKSITNLKPENPEKPEMVRKPDIHNKIIKKTEGEI
jgi:outer membrane protein